MKWIGQHIWDFISRFRSDVYLEATESGTIASGGNLGLDANNKIVKESDTGITDLHGAGVDGSANNILTDDGDGTITSESTLTYSGTVLTQTATPSGNFTAYALTATTAVGWATGTNTGYGVLNTFDKDDNTNAAGVNTYTGIRNDINDTASDNRNLTQLTGVHNTINYANDAASGNVMAWGTINDITNGDSQYGVQNILTGGATAATTYGIYQKIDDGGHDLYFLSSDTTTVDYFSLRTGASGATTLETVDGGGTAAHFEIAADGDITLDSAGQIKLEPVAGNNILLDGTVTVDGGSVTGITTLGVDSVSLTAVQTSGESFVDNDTSVMTSAAIDDRINAAIPDETVSTGTFILSQTKVTLDEAACNNLAIAPQILVAAPGSDKIIIPHTITMLIDRDASTPQSNAACDLFISWDGGVALGRELAYVRRFMYNEGGDRIYHFGMAGGYSVEAGSSLSSGTNVALKVQLDSVPTSGSIDGMTIYTTYHIIDNS